VGILNSDPGELPRRKHTTFRTQQKFEIKKIVIDLHSIDEQHDMNIVIYSVGDTFSSAQIYT
jgi:hypothetical protein